MPAATWPNAASTALVLAEALTCLGALGFVLLLGAVGLWVRLGLWQAAIKAGAAPPRPVVTRRRKSTLHRALRVAGWFRAASPQRVASLDALGRLCLQQGKLDEAERS